MSFGGMCAGKRRKGEKGIAPILAVLCQIKMAQFTLLEKELSMQQEQLTQFAEQVKALQGRLAKDSHNSHLPPSSDRFSRQPKSLRKKSGKKPGGQEGHPGKTLLFSPCPDEVMEDLLAASMSEGTLCDLIGRCASNLAEVEQHIKEALIASCVIHQDETGLYVAGHRQWMHVTCTSTLTHYGVHAKRCFASMCYG